MMPSSQFAKGFKGEVQNRAFALRAIGRLANRLDGDPRQPLWAAYLKLEEFNAPVYRQAAARWGIGTTPGAGTRIKAWVIGSVPKCLLRPFLKFVHAKTVVYCDELRKLRNIGPSDSRIFLDYMVDQEDFQIELMRLSLDGQDAVLARKIDSFLEKYDGKFVVKKYG
ncbi:hypothetical protein [Burkholderia arboris]|uniref:hypothetical protein n=1 Tax=Burkholderia arboris TaxID=488730 RepID=UPI002109CF3F|nr:hypothetical protein [Burkholderia arboris]UTV59953.1 hypothetical protein NLX30_37855 [Burkholderia arboris]